MQSIAHQSLRGCPEASCDWFLGRLIALSEAHDVLTDQGWQGAGIRELFARVTAPLRAPDDRRFECAGPDLFLSPRMALSLSMALHELCTNAAKYGALSTSEGRVLVTWSIAVGTASAAAALGGTGWAAGPGTDVERLWIAADHARRGA